MEISLTSPNGNIANAVQEVVRVVQVYRVLEANASGKTCKDTKSEEECDRDLGVPVHLNAPKERHRPKLESATAKHSTKRSGRLTAGRRTSRQ